MSQSPMSPATPRQTQRYLRELFEARGLRPRSKLGQCFLIDLNLLELILREADLGPEDLVLEVGSGTGSLTTHLAQRAGAVLGVEIDRGLFQIATEVTSHFPNVKLLSGDILAGKHRLNPDVLTHLQAALERGTLKRVKLNANLPYVVATPVLVNLLLTELPLARMIVMVQWELAARLTAAPRTPDFGALTVLVQNLAEVEMVRKLPPSAFWPRPKVDSAIVRIDPAVEKRRRVGDVAAFQHFVHHLYLHRRKNLRSGLHASLSERLGKSEIDALLLQAGFDGQARAETLSPDEHLRLAHALAAALR